MNAQPPPLHNEVADRVTGRATQAWAMYFQTIAPILPQTGTHAERVSARFDPMSYAAGTQFYEIDRGLVYENRESFVATFVDADSVAASADVFVNDTAGFAVGQIIKIGGGTVREERRAISSIAAGVSLTVTQNLDFTHTAADRDWVVASLGDRAWRYVSGEMRGTLDPDERPADAGVNDTGLQFYSTDFQHSYRWDGAAWDWAPGERGTGEVAMFIAAPTSGVWALCDGSSADRANNLGAVSAFTTPDLIGQFLKGATAYTGTSVPGTGGTLSGTVAAESAHTHNIFHIHPSGSTSAVTLTSTNIANGTGATISVATPAAHSHTFNTPAFAGDSGSGVSHTHGIGTLAVTGSPEPDHMELLPYIRC